MTDDLLPAINAVLRLARDDHGVLGQLTHAAEHLREGAVRAGADDCNPSHQTTPRARRIFSTAALAAVGRLGA